MPCWLYFLCPELLGEELNFFEDIVNDVLLSFNKTLVHLTLLAVVVFVVSFS